MGPSETIFLVTDDGDLHDHTPCWAEHTLPAKTDPTTAEGRLGLDGIPSIDARVRGDIARGLCRLQPAANEAFRLRFARMTDASSSNPTIVLAYAHAAGGNDKNNRSAENIVEFTCKKLEARHAEIWTPIHIVTVSSKLRFRGRTSAQSEIYKILSISALSSSAEDPHAG